MKVYERTENGTTETLTVKEAMPEVNHAMMGGRRDVRTMSSSYGQHQIEYKDGRTVRLVLVDAPESTPEQETPAAAEIPADEPREWRGTHTRFNNLHRFVKIGTDPRYGDQYRARCNKRIYPAYCPQGDKPNEYQTRSEILSREYGDVYTFCPRCDAK